MVMETARIYAIVPTTNLDRAREFYEHTLGLHIIDAAIARGHVLFEGADGSRLFVYERGHSSDADHTLVSFEVDHLEEAMGELRAKGIEFEEYELPGIKTDEGIATIGKMRGAWFKDPDGNTIGLSEYH